MTVGTHGSSLQHLRAQLDELIASCTTIRERRIGYGNLRCESSNWHRADEEITNIALIYETPGGSTCQINVAYDHHSGQFTYLGDELNTTVTTSDSQEVLAMLNQQIRAIPQKRLSFLRQQIDHWMDEGKTRRQLFAELNKLLQTEFLGGRISTTELRDGIQYALARHTPVP